MPLVELVQSTTIKAGLILITAEPAESSTESVINDTVTETSTIKQETTTNVPITTNEIIIYQEEEATTNQLEVIETTLTSITDFEIITSENETTELIDTTENVISEATTINSEINEKINNATENISDLTTTAIEYSTNSPIEESATIFDESSADLSEIENELFIELLTEIFNENLQLDDSVNDEKDTYMDSFEATTISSEISEGNIHTTDLHTETTLENDNYKNDSMIDITTVSTSVVFPTFDIPALEFEALHHNTDYIGENINTEKEVFVVMPEELKTESSTTAKPLIIWPQGHVSFPDEVETEGKVSNFVHFIDLEIATENAFQPDDIVIDVDDAVDDIPVEERDFSGDNTEHSTIIPVKKWPQRLVNTYIPESDVIESNNQPIVDVIETKDIIVETISEEIIEDNLNDLELSVETEEIISTEVKSEKDNKFKDKETFNVLRLAMETAKILIPRNLQNTFTISRPLFN